MSKRPNISVRITGDSVVSAIFNPQIKIGLTTPGESLTHTYGCCAAHTIQPRRFIFSVDVPACV